MSCFLLFSTKLLKICTNGLWFLLKDAKSFRSSSRREAWCPARRSTSRQTPGSSSPSSSGKLITLSLGLSLFLAFSISLSLYFSFSLSPSVSLFLPLSPPRALFLLISFSLWSLVSRFLFITALSAGSTQSPSCSTTGINIHIFKIYIVNVKHMGKRFEISH